MTRNASWLLLGVCVGLAIAAAPARSRSPVPPDVFKAVRAEWHTRAERVKAFDIVSCETEDRYNTTATNGQYLGIFQMGLYERGRCGHGSSARAQARAARCWYDLTGHDFGAWSCA